MTDYKLELPPCTSFCQNSDNSNGICRACMEREKTAHGILLNIAKRMTADSCIDYPQWLFTLVEEAIKMCNTRTQPQPIDVEKLKLAVFNAVKYEIIAGETIEGLGDVTLIIDHLAAHYNITPRGE